VIDSAAWSSPSGRHVAHCGDNLEILRAMPGKSVDLIFTSPPYEAARTYGIDFNLRGEEWVQWAFVRFMECLRVCCGVVAWNVAGQTRNYRWSAVPMLLAADLHRAGVNLRTPPLYMRDGIPGSGGPDWLKNQYEFIICATPPGKLPWSDNTACGHPPKFGPGGAPTHRKADGSRGHQMRAPNDTKNGDLAAYRAYIPPQLANPGNIIDCGPGGGGHLGHEIAHENEAPFPLKLAEVFVRSFCPPDGKVMDIHGGSGTVMHAAEIHGRQSISIDVREAQIDLIRRRYESIAEKTALFQEQAQ
jgi:hypothetical protein